MPDDAPDSDSDPGSEDATRRSPAMALRVEGLRAALVRAGVAASAGASWLSPGAPASGSVAEPWLSPGTATVGVEDGSWLSPGTPAAGVLVMALASLELVDSEGSKPAAAVMPLMPSMPLVAGSAVVEVEGGAGELETAPTAATIWSKTP